MDRPPSPLPTRAAEGLPRRRFTVAELEQMTAAGIVAEDERIELIGGEVVPMSARGSHHEILKTALNLYSSRNLSEDLLCTTETTFRLSADGAGIRVLSQSGGMAGTHRRNRALVVEIADSSLGYDLGRKADLYASFGIAELWVINAVKLETRIHRLPAAAPQHG